MTFSEFWDSLKSLIGIVLTHVQDEVSDDFKVVAVTDSNVVISSFQNKGKFIPINQVERLWNGLMNSPFANPNDVLGVSGTNRRHPATLIAATPHFFSIKEGGSLYLAYLSGRTHPLGKLATFTKVEAQADYLARAPAPTPIPSGSHSTSRSDYPLNLILKGPPGTGKTYTTVAHSVAIADGAYFNIHKGDRAAIRRRYQQLKAEGIIKTVTFHPAFTYEQFVEGTFVETSSEGEVQYVRRDGVLKEIADQARTARSGGNPRPYVLVIDEINRGNIARIFGELITLLEEDKREGAEEAESIILPQSRASFSVPDNLYILGTMNTADRSITKIDIALQRRFKFWEILPNPSLLSLLPITEGGIDLQKLLAALNLRIEAFAGPDRLLGHAFLLKVTSLMGLATVFETEILPRLNEYFMGDMSQVREVLGDADRDEDHQFYKELDLGGLGIKGVRSAKVFRLNKKALAEAATYRQIYDDIPDGLLSEALKNIDTDDVQVDNSHLTDKESNETATDESPVNINLEEDGTGGDVLAQDTPDTLKNPVAD